MSSTHMHRSSVADDSIPPLETGDRLSRDEFERRYEAMSGLKKAELIEGVVYVPSPVRARKHGGPHADLMGWLFVYKMATRFVEVFDNTSFRLDPNNEPQPDASMFLLPEYGGRAWIDEDDYLAGHPEFLGEIALSSVSYDSGDKLTAYERNGVQEYLVWRVLDREFDWFALREGRYERLVSDQSGVIRSQVFPGLWLDPAAMVRRDIATVIKVLQQGLGSSEHADFLAKLKAAKR